jgi:UDP-galactopyranose mutase
MKQYDYVIVGSGLAGSVSARILTDKGYKVLVIDKNPHIGGLCWDEKKDDYYVQKYGVHIFHTSNEKVWKFMNTYTEFNNYRHKVMVNYKDQLYSFPINLLTLYQLWGVKSPKDAEEVLKQITNKEGTDNLESWILSQVGEEIYKKFIYGYTRKQWDKELHELPSSIIKRIPIRTTFDDNYYFSKYQGIPVNGYNQIFNKLLKEIDVSLNVNYFDNKEYYNNIAKNIIYTGKVDEYFDYKYGELEYRGLIFVEEELKMKDYQGLAVMNYTDETHAYTRMIEHKHLYNSKTNTTVVTKEYPFGYRKENTPYYPVPTIRNMNIYTKYKKLCDDLKNVTFIGRLAEYKYYDMDNIVESVLNKFK